MKLMKSSYFREITIKKYNYDYICLIFINGKEHSLILSRNNTIYEKAKVIVQ